MVRPVLIFLFLILLTSALFAQDNALTGRIYENKTKIAIPGIVIKNLKTQSTTVSDRTGGFSIAAHIGDLVTFTGFSYQPDTLFVHDLKYTEIQLILKGKMLKEVQVTGQETRLGNLKATPTLSPIGSQALVYSTDEKGNYKGGLTASIFDSHSAENKRKHEVQIAKDEGVKSQIADLFSAESLKNYIPLDGQEMQNFIVTYTPDIKTYTDPAFNITSYLNTCYKEFMKIPAEERKSKDFQQIFKSN